MTESTIDENHPARKCPVYRFPFGMVPFARIVDDPAIGRILYLDGDPYEMPRDWVMNRINPLTMDTEVYVGPWYRDKDKYAKGFWVELEMLKSIIDI